MTKEGYDELQNELSERKTKKRSEIAARIEDAKAQGDLSENSEYDEA
ncbi:MAG: transcription elongation factor GreA, partial [Saccharofermentans sp.]|nr:transcription elongation factor GreA [Saccharofermentans sp.]